MNLPNKLTITRIILVPILILIYMFPYATFGINVPMYHILNAGISLVNIVIFIIFAVASLTDYFDDHASLSLIQHSWGETDYLYMFIQEMDNNNQVMPPVSQEDIYRWCEEGEKRYEKSIPPGFEDAKKKDGVFKYSEK